MILGKIPIELKSAYLRHGAVFHKDTKSWTLDETGLSEENKAFFLKRGYFFEEEEVENGIVMNSKVDIMHSLRRIPFKTLPLSTQIHVMEVLSGKIRDDRDMDISFPDFYRIADIDDIIDIDSYIAKKEELISTEDKIDTDKDYDFTPFEKALFRFEWDFSMEM